MKRDKSCVITSGLSSKILQLSWVFHIFTHSWRHHQTVDGNTSGFSCYSKVQKHLKASTETSWEERRQQKL